MDNNEAVVCKIANICEIPNKQKIVSASISLLGMVLTQVVVGKGDYKENDLVIYFDSNLCLTDMLIDAIDKTNELHNSKDFQSVARYLSKGNRIRCIALGATVSNGLTLPVEKFYQFFKTDSKAKEVLREGFSFTKLGEQEICKKYLPPVKHISTPGSGKKKGKKHKLISRVIPSMFNFHIDTAQLLRNIHVLDPDQLISVSSKWHGTSAIVSHTEVLRKLSPVERVLKVCKVKLNEHTYDTLYASRTIVKNDLLNGTGFYSVNVWQEAGEKFFKGKLHEGESVYYEIVGYLPGTQTFIQKKFDYGCAEGEYAIRVYRITLTSHDGTVSEYSWSAMKERCAELGVPMVVEYYYGKAKEMYPDIPVDENWKLNFVQRLKDTYLEKDNPFCRNKVPDEGVVLRIEGLKINVFKLKSERFILKENELKDAGELDVEDEEQAAVAE